MERKKKSPTCMVGHICLEQGVRIQSVQYGVSIWSLHTHSNLR